MIRWPLLLADMERAVWAGPEDEFDEACNGDPDSLNGEEDESGFDESPVEAGWEDFDFEGEEDDGEDEDDC